MIGGGQAASSSDILRLIIDRKIWFGVKKWSENVYFIPGEYSDEMMTKRSYKECDGEVMTTINICVWWTNIEHNHRRPLECSREYREGEYKKFDGTNIINIDDIRDIPKDYMGYMGVPVTFLERWNYEQFEVIGFGMSGSGGDDMFAPIVEGDYKFRRILIRRKKDG